jgi:hypothetical protein
MYRGTQPTCIRWIRYPLNVPLSAGGECGPRAFFTRFVRKAWGMPTWGVTEPGHAAMSTFGPAGWEVLLGAGENTHNGSRYMLLTTRSWHIYLGLLRHPPQTPRPHAPIHPPLPPPPVHHHPPPVHPPPIHPSHPPPIPPTPPTPTHPHTTYRLGFCLVEKPWWARLVLRDASSRVPP